MSHKTVNATVSAVVPCAHLDWKGNPPGLPWAVYYGDESPIGADDSEIAKFNRWTVELYERKRDAELELALGNALREQFGPVTRRETARTSEEYLIVTYDFSELESDFDG